MDDKNELDINPEKIKQAVKAELKAGAKKAIKAELKSGKKKAKSNKSKAIIDAIANGSKRLAKKINDKVNRSVRRAIKQQTSSTHSVKENRLELLFTIVNRSKAEYYVDLLHSFDVTMQVILLGQGTAQENMVTLFGLGDLDKAVILSVIKEREIKNALATLEDKFRTIKNGKGIAYTVPLDGVIGTLIYSFLSNSHMTAKDNSKKERKKS